MKTLLFGGLLAALLAIAVAAALNPVKALTLLRAVGGFLLERIRAVVEWARDPRRNWWKIGCVGFAGFFALAAFYADQQRREVITIAERCTTITTTLRGDLAAARATGELDRTDLTTCRAFMADVIAGRQDVTAENTEALLALERAARQADARAQEWKRRYDAKTPDCATALTVLEEKCAAFSDY